jgi:hypothetical protein
MSTSARQILIFGLFFLIALGTGYFLRKKHATRPAAGGDIPLSETYLGLRRQVLQGLHGKVELPATKKPTEPYAVVMDWNTGNAIATIVSIADGTASMYLSNGGGSIGGGQGHKEIREAALSAVSLAADVQPQMKSVFAYPLPMRGEVIFYLVTEAGVFSASAPANELATGKHPLSRLGNAMQNIITQYRLVEPAK